MANEPSYTNAKQLIDRIRACARRASDAMSEMRSLEAEVIRVGGDTRLSPVFFTLDDPPVARVDVGFSLAELDLALSSFKILSGGADNGLAGLDAQVLAAWAAIDKIKV